MKSSISDLAMCHPVNSILLTSDLNSRASSKLSFKEYLSSIPRAAAISKICGKVFILRKTSGIVRESKSSCGDQCSSSMSSYRSLRFQTLKGLFLT